MAGLDCMATLVSCPNCKGRGNLPDNMVGKKIRCKRCGNIFLAIPDSDTDKINQGRAAAQSAQAPTPPAKPASDDPDDMLL